MSQLERQYEELEEYGRQIEETLRDTESSKSVKVWKIIILNSISKREFNVDCYYVGLSIFHSSFS